MTTPSHNRVSEVFCEACERGPAEREAYLAEACRGDPELRAQVESLLAYDDRDSDLFCESRLGIGRELAMPPGPDGAGEPGGDGPIPEHIGRYKVIRRIGLGGMGTVFEAEQDNPRRTVAIKIVRPGPLSKEASARFVQEAKVLGRLRHPGIAQIYEAGMADTGQGPQPYFAMELIRGQGLAEHAKSRHLNARERLRLLAEVCDAVEYAHSQGVIHRDLKPANILVDEHGQPKVLDFGVARVASNDAQITTLHTTAGQLVGTLAYMSPEQVSGDQEAVDARSDVYALGMLLYELLAARAPYDLRNRPVHDAARIIREDEPSRLGLLDTTFRGDVETIAAKALEKEKERRYQTAGDLAADIRRFLRDEPIVAHRATTLYQLRKFARRHPGLVGGVGAAFLALVLGVTGTSIGMMRARRAERLAVEHDTQAQAQKAVAEHEAAKARRVSSAIRGILESARPGGTGEGLQLVDMLARADADLGQRLADEPEVELEVRRVLATTYSALGFIDRKEISLQRAYDLVRAASGAESEAALHAADQLGVAMADRVATGIAPAEVGVRTQAFLEGSLATARRVLGNTHPTTVGLMYSLAVSLHDGMNWERAEPLARELSEALRAMPPEDRPASLPVALLLLARAQAWRHDESGCARLMDEAQGLIRYDGEHAVGVIHHPANLLVELFADLGENQRAVSILRLLLRAQIDRLGPSHFETVKTKGRLAMLLVTQGEFAEALELQSAWYAHWRTYLPANDDGRVWGESAVAALLAQTGRREESAAAFEEAIRIRRLNHGDTDPLAREIWARGVMRLGLGIQDRWESEVLRAATRWQVWNTLVESPTTTFSPDEIRWPEAGFVLTPCQSATEPADSSAELRGGFKELRALPELAPGLYRLKFWAPRGDYSIMRCVFWVLSAPWQVRLYNNSFVDAYDLSAWREHSARAPAEERIDPTLDFMGWWGRGFGPFGHEYSFGMVATTRVDLPAGRYRFTLAADDGAIFWLDGRELINSRVARGEPLGVARTADVELAAGGHDLRVEYFQFGGPSLLRLSAEPLYWPVPASGPTEEGKPAG